MKATKTVSQTFTIVDYYDTETGFYYLQSRYYDPVTHRFINADSYASTGQGIIGTNMFVYCGNNPIVCIDSSGAEAYVVVGGSSLRLDTLNFKIELEYKVLYMVDNEENYEVEVSSLMDGVSISAPFLNAPIDLSFGISSDGEIEVSTKCPVQISDKVSVNVAANGTSMSIEVSIEGENELLHCISLTVKTRKMPPTLKKRTGKANAFQARKAKKVVDEALWITGVAIISGLLVYYGAKKCRHAF